MIFSVDMPINRKLTLIILLTSGFSLLLVGLATIVSLEMSARRSMVQEMTVLSDLLGRYSTAALSFHRDEDIDEVQKILSAVRADSHIMEVRLYDKGGQAFGEYVREGEVADFPVLPPTNEHRFVGNYLEVSHLVELDRKTMGTIYLRADLEKIYGQRNLHIGVITLVLIGVILMTFFLSPYLRRPITEPILALADIARQVAEKKDYAIRAIPQGTNEIGLLTDAFNQMLSEIETAQRSLQKAYQSLQEDEKKIHQLNSELERRVVERTVELEKANKELEAFSYSISHDLRAPLRTVDGFSKVVEEDCGPQLSEEGKRYLKMIREGAQKMGTLIDDLLSFSRLSRSPLGKREVQTADLVSEVWEGLSSQWQGRKIELVLGNLPVCQGDFSLLKQVWVNLVSNAIKYTRHCEVARIEIGSLEEKGETVYFIRDNGAGFDMKYSNKLFGVFQRFHRAEDYEGTGVGLAIVQRIIQRHGGRIWAESAVDQGSTFYFRL
ncbi:MAG: ATP-binding protein [Verrucomicrobiota bacterium]